MEKLGSFGCFCNVFTGIATIQFNLSSQSSSTTLQNFPVTLRHFVIVSRKNPRAPSEGIEGFDPIHSRHGDVGGWLGGDNAYIVGFLRA